MNTVFLVYVPGVAWDIFFTEKCFTVIPQLEFNWELCVLSGNPNLEVKDTDFQALRQEEADQVGPTRGS